MHPLKRKVETRDDLFLSRYVRLRELALKLSDYNLQEAEDLLHDSFIYFTLCQTPVERIENLDAYLYTMLRNLRLSRVRRLARLPQGQLSLIDYDSAELGLNSVDPRDQIRIQDELRAICRYAIARKDSAKVGSVLILRFFHGYLPTEIASVLKVKRSAVDNLLQTARREARLYNSDPNSITFLAADKSVQIPEFNFGQLSDDILTEVRQAIFQKPSADCPLATLREAYVRADPADAGSNVASVDVSLLAHIVSCQPCLQEVNDLLNIPNVSTRMNSDIEDSDKKPRSGGGSGGGNGGLPSADKFLRSSRKRLKQIFEHQPQELMIAVNGFIIGSQKINSDLNELALSVNLDEKIGFVEVFSERDVCLLFQSVEPPPEGPAIQPARVELSGDRILELSLDFSGAWPQISASYHDPSYSEARSLAADSLISRKSPETQSESTGSSVSSGTLAGAVASLIERLRDISFRSWLQPEHVTAALAVLAILAFAFWKFTNSTPVQSINATDLLARAATAEQQLAAASDIVVHKTIDLEERNERGDVIAKRRIDGWSSGEQRLSVRRLYNEQGKLVAGEWDRADGSRTLYSTYQKTKALPSQDPAPVSIDDAWLTEPSARAFQRLSGPNAAVDIQESQNTYTVSYSPAETNTASAPRIAKATVVFRKDDLRAIDQTLLIQSGEQQREYRYVEANYVRLSPQSVSPSVFEPERELLGNPPVVLKRRDTQDTATDTPAAPVVADEPVPARVAATADLEVEALNLLNQAGADTGEQINVTHDKEGVLKIDGLVNTETRKNELLRVLSPIANHPGVRINILTVAEAVAKEQRRKKSQKQPDNVSVEMFNAGGESPVQAKLRSFFGSDDAANGFAIKMISRSRSAMSHAGALKRLINQFSTAELESLSPDAHAKWLALIRSHARAFQQETAALRQELSTVFAVGAASGTSATPINDDSALVRAVERLFDLGAANDRTVRSALSISNDRAAGLSQEFFRNLRTTEEIAERVQQIK